MYQKAYHIHFVGIGGIGMSGIAELLLNLGYRVSGSDLKASDITRRLARLGGTVHEGHRSEQVAGADVVVMSSAVSEDNPEIAAARAAAIPVIPRAEMLAELMRLKYSIAVAGAHGKTTTTSIVSSVLAEGGLDPTVVIGGKLRGVDTNAVLGSGSFLVAEADESDGSFLRMAPSIAVVTNIDREHLDHYRDLDDIIDAFARFIDRIPFYGLAVVCLDNEPVQALIPRIQKRLVTYGMSRQADIQAADVACEGQSCRFRVRRGGEDMGTVVLSLPGVHNVYNALASIAVGLEVGIGFETIRSALGRLEGVRRRMEIKGERGGVVVVDDYAHHPTEIKSTLQAVGDGWRDRRKIVVFQPHRYTRTQALFDDFTRAFYQSDVLVVLPIYPAGEKAIPGVAHGAICEGVRAHGHKNVICIERMEEAPGRLADLVTAGDLVITLGAGNVWEVGETLLDRLDG